MSDFRLTKSAMRDQQNRLKQLEKYLPTLQLKKAMLQLEVANVQYEIEGLEKKEEKALALVNEFIALLGRPLPISLDETIRVERLDKRIENIAGVDVPFLDRVLFHPIDYSLQSVPGWIDHVVIGLQNWMRAKLEVSVAEERKAALAKELREVSIRVNLFEKRLIPDIKRNIKKIAVFLNDQELSGVARAKVAKEKVEAKKAQEAAGVMHAD